MKVLFVLPTLKSGGAEKVIITHLRNLSRTSIEVKLLLFFKGGVYDLDLPEDIEVVYCVNRPGRLSRNLGKIFFKFWRNLKDVDLVFACVETYCTYICVILSQLLGKRMSAFVHVPLIYRLKRHGRFEFFVNRFLYSFVDTVFTCSKGVRNEIFHFCGGNPIKYITVYNPIEIIEGPSSIDEKIARFIGEGRKVLINVGRLSHEKNQKLFLEVLYHLNVISEDWRGLILGEGEEYTELVNHANALGVSENVMFGGFQKYLRPILERGSIFLLTSRYEGFGNVLVEAMLCGLPVVSVNCNYGPSEIISDGESGILVDETDGLSIAKKILSTFSLGNERRIINNAYLRASSFSPKKAVERLDLYFETLATRRRAV